MILFLIGAVRALVEMLGLCLIAQAFLYVLTGARRTTNPIYQLFDLITRGPRRLVGKALPKSASPIAIGLLSFIFLLLCWIGLALLRKFV